MSTSTMADLMHNSANNPINAASVMIPDCTKKKVKYKRAHSVAIEPRRPAVVVVSVGNNARE
jgi:hypothetical protein